MTVRVFKSFGSLRGACIVQLPLNRFSPAVLKIASSLRGASIGGHGQVPLLTQTTPDFDQQQAYEVSAASCAQALSQGYMPVGRKIGFTNSQIWSQYNVSEPNWGYLMDRSCYDSKNIGAILLTPATMMLQPRIEPEIVFGLKARPHSYMSEKEALSCVEWMAHGFEIVTSVFKDWEFSLADTTAANALHHRLIIGKRVTVQHEDADTLLSQLKNFTIDMRMAKYKLAKGSGRNVLGSPIQALLRLCRILESQTLHPNLCPGEIITTGTLTEALPVRYRDIWTTELTGIDLPGLKKPISKLHPPNKEQSKELKKRRLSKSTIRRVDIWNAAVTDGRK